MKKLALLFSLALLLTLSACNTAPTPTFDDPIPPFALRNEETGAVISLGMTRDEAEALLGEGTQFDRQAAAEAQWGERDGWILVTGPRDYDTYHYGEGGDFLALDYEEGRVVGISHANWLAGHLPGPTNWFDCYGLSHGADKALMFAHYGEKETLLTSEADEAGNSYSVYGYYYDSADNPVENHEGASYVVMVTTEEGKSELSVISMHAISPVPDPAASPATLQNVFLGVTVAPGMTREEISARLGEGTEIDWPALMEELQMDIRYGPEGSQDRQQFFTYGEGADFLWVIYLDGEAHILATTQDLLGKYPQEVTNWYDRYGITHGTESADILARYGTPPWYDPEDSDSPFFLTYYFDRTGEIVENQDDALWHVVFALERDEAGGDAVVHIGASLLDWNGGE